MKQNQAMETALFQAAALTFEELGFLFSNDDLGPEQLGAEVDGTVRVNFQGPFNGHFVLRVCGDLLPTIAANMLGEAEPPSPEMQEDVLGELGNVVCGNALPLIAGRTEVFRLSAPCVVYDTIAGAATAQTQIGLEQGRADLLLFIEKEAVSN